MEAMRSLFTAAIFSMDIIVTVSDISYGNFIRIDGYKLTSPFAVGYYQFSRLKCAETCLQNICSAINYHVQTQECQLNSDTPYTNPEAVEEVQGWAIFYLQRDTDWELVFRAKANNSLSPYNTWMGTSSAPTPVQDGCRLMTGTFTCNSIYRSDVLDSWQSQSISEVKLEMYRHGKRVVRTHFNGTGSTFTDWFGIDRLIDSGWSTLNENRTFNYFQLLGSDSRRFFINQNYGGCSNDAGWMVVIDVDNGYRVCDWDSMVNRPVFKYAPGENATRWIEYAHEEADVLAVFLKR
ncbi:uncharacterized protein [Argopecten irradians]|uniref:uncharacterized protein n=1 Tax=Argopecten irradians TaxID=31199 RepID=UPI0037168E7B